MVIFFNQLSETITRCYLPVLEINNKTAGLPRERLGIDFIHLNGF